MRKKGLYSWILNNVVASFRYHRQVRRGPNAPIVVELKICSFLKLYINLWI